MLQVKHWIVAMVSLAGCGDAADPPATGDSEDAGSASTSAAATTGVAPSDTSALTTTSSDGSTANETEPDEMTGESGDESGTTTGAVDPPPCTRGESAIGPIAETMAPGEWRDISDVFPMHPENFYDMGSPIFAYTDEAQWDSVRRRVYFIGQGHHSNNDENPETAARFYAYHDCANEWQQLPDIPTNQGTPAAGNIGHQYDHSALDEERGLFFHAPYNAKALYVYDIEVGEWSVRDQPAEVQAPITYDITQGIEFFPAYGNQVIWYTSAWGIFAFDPATDAWSSVASPVGTDTYHELARIVPAHDAVLLGGGNDSTDLFRLDADGSVTPIAAAPTALGIHSSGGFLAAPGGAAMLLLGADGTLFTYDVPSDAWTEHSIAPVPLQDGNQVLVALDTHGVVLLVSYDQGAWLYRHG